jgi:hypothetical protein
MNAPHADHIDTAFLQLSFAIKLWHFLDVHRIDKEAFDIDLTVKDPGSQINLKQNEFESYAHLQLTAENNISICFGVAAITLWEAIHECSGLSPKGLQPNNNKAENLAALSYMIRCCFAHGTARPIWSIRNDKYRTEYRVGNKTINLAEIADDQPFDYASIDGYETLWHLKEEARAVGLLGAAEEAQE